MKKLLKLEDEAAAAAQMDTFGETATTTTTHPFAACCCINWNLLTQERRMPKTTNSATPPQTRNAAMLMQRWLNSALEFLSPELDGMTWHGYYYHQSSSHYTRGFVATNEIIISQNWSKMVVFRIMIMDGQIIFRLGLFFLNTNL